MEPWGRPPCSTGPRDAENHPRPLGYERGLRYHLVTVPLSDHEQKILDEIEKSLATEDPRFADKRVSRSPKAHARRARLGALMFFGGLVLLVAFFVSRMLIVGLLAFGGMVAGIVLLASAVGSMVRETADRSRSEGRSFASSMSEWEDAVRKRFRRP